MPTVTVLAPDSALAMDEVIRQLGDNAYILATYARDGQVEILATNEPTQIQTPRKRATTVSFADVISEQVAQGSAPPAVFKTVRAAQDEVADEPDEPSQTQGATIVKMNEARARTNTAGSVAKTTGPKVDTPADPAQKSNASHWDAALGARETEAAPKQASMPLPVTTDAPEAALTPLLRELAAQLARLEAAATQKHTVAAPTQDAITDAGFSGAIAKMLAPGPDAADRVPQFVAAMAKRLTAPDPIMSLRVPVLVIVGPSGAGKTVLAAKFAALTLETHASRTVELISISQTPQVAESALPIYARMLSVGHRSIEPDHLDASQVATPTATHVLDTNLEPEPLHAKLAEMRGTLGRGQVAVILALPVGTSPARLRAELTKYQEFDPVIALTKLDECELSPQEASQIAEFGTPIAWLSGTRALTETMAPATVEMIDEFLTGLLAVRS